MRRQSSNHAESESSMGTSDLSGTSGEAPESFESLYTREFPGLVATAYALTGSRSVAEELVHDAFLAAHRKWATVGSMDRPGAWVRKVLLRAVYSRTRRLRAEARAVLHLTNAPSVAQAPLRSADDDGLWAEVRKLPRQQATVVGLRYVNDLPFGEIAEAMGCEPSTARAHLTRAHRTLADRLSTTWDPELTQAPTSAHSTTPTAPTATTTPTAPVDTFQVDYPFTLEKPSWVSKIN